MHESSMNEMRNFVENTLKRDRSLRVLDVGSYDFNGTYRGFFVSDPCCDYVGLDIRPGPNVDIVVSPDGHWPLADDTFDVVISGQCLEHVSRPWLLVPEFYRVCKPGGWTFVTAPWSWVEHGPVDFWRILPNGMLTLMVDIAGFVKHQCYKNTTDTVFIGRKCS